MQRTNFISFNVHSAFGLSIVGAIAGIVSALSGPAAPIVVPIAAGVVIASWVYEVYQQSYVLPRILHRKNNDRSLSQPPSAPAFHEIHHRLDPCVANAVSRVGKPGTVS
jgi:hypothetical protein